MKIVEKRQNEFPYYTSQKRQKQKQKKHRLNSQEQSRNKVDIINTVATTEEIREKLLFGVFRLHND